MTDRSAWGGSYREHSRKKRRHNQHLALVQYLSPEEKAALKDLSHYLTQHRVPPSKRLRLISLGLASVSEGKVVLTGVGRRALAALLGLSKRQ